jgi:hypothetical protein
MNRRPFPVRCALALTTWLVSAPSLAAPAVPPAGPSGPASPEAAIAGSSTPEPACADGVVKDDGSLETGWGWVPSVIEGEYVQVFHSSEFENREVEAVCVCWLRTREDASIDFEVVFYHSVPDDEDGDPQPAEAPYAVVPATAAEVPRGIVGAFTEVGFRPVGIPSGELYIGVRWNPSVDQFFFVCADTTPGTPRVNLFFRDDRAEGWDNAFETSDPLFVDHRAVLVRARSRRSTIVDVPALSAAGLGILAALLAAAGWRLSRPSRR